MFHVKHSLRSDAGSKYPTPAAGDFATPSADLEDRTLRWYADPPRESLADETLLHENLESRRARRRLRQCETELCQTWLRPSPAVGTGRLTDYNASADPEKGRRALRSYRRRPESTGNHEIKPPSELDVSAKGLRPLTHHPTVREAQTLHCVGQEVDAPTMCVDEDPRRVSIARRQHQTWQATAAAEVNGLGRNRPTVDDERERQCMCDLVGDRARA